VAQFVTLAGVGKIAQCWCGDSGDYMMAYRVGFLAEYYMKVSIHLVAGRTQMGLDHYNLPSGQGLNSHSFAPTCT
jgi:hypothetical protein